MTSASENKPGSRVHEKRGRDDGVSHERAVALRYEAGSDPAPRIVAAGQGEVAKRIVKTARQHDIPVYPEPDLAEVLSRLDLGAVVPPETYAVVAKIMAFIYSLDRTQGPSSNNR